MKNYLSNLQSGAALLITMLLIATVGALALSVGRITLSELRITTSYTDSIIAYEAAEAGIEEGLYKFRENRSQEITDSQDLSEGVSYNLNINFKSEGRVNLARATGRVKKDEIKEVDVSNLGGASVIINWAWWEGEEDKRIGLEVILIPAPPRDSESEDNESGERHFYEYQATLLDQDSKQITIPSIAQRMRLKPLGRPLSSLEIEAVGCLVPGECKIDTGITNIESVGICGKSQRKLVAEIDRRSGQILGIFDYTLYSRGDIKK